MSKYTKTTIEYGVTVNRYYDISGKLHRENDQPAIVRSDGSVEYYLDGKRHRNIFDSEGNRKPAIVRSDGSTEYWVNGNKL